MKKTALLMIFCTCFLLFGQDTHKSIIGTWIGYDHNWDKGGIEFRTDATAKILVGDYQSIPVKEYIVDYTKEPIWVDLKVEDDGQMITYHGLIQFIDSLTIKWELFPMAGELHPNYFSDNKENTVILKKSN